MSEPTTAAGKRLLEMFCGDDELPHHESMTELAADIAAIEREAGRLGVIGCDGDHEPGSTLGCEDPKRCVVAQGRTR